MKDVFGIDTEIGGAWQLEGAVLHIEDSEDLIVTATDIRYARVNSRFSPINQRKKYVLTGEANGVITMGMIIGPSKGIKEFLERYADPCYVDRNMLTVQPAGVKTCSTDTEPIEFKCGGVLINDIQVASSQIGQMAVVSAGLTLSFLTLQIK